MKRIQAGLLAMACLFAIYTHAQSVDDIISKHIVAVGGQDKITGIKTIVISTNMSVMGNDAPMTTTILNGKGFRNEIEINGTKVIQVVTDKGGWSINPMMGAATAQQMSDDEYKAGANEIFIGGPLLNYAAKGYKAQYTGREKVGAVDADKVTLTTSDNSSYTFYFDPATYYIIKQVRNISVGGSPTETVSNFSDFKKTDYGYIIPYTVETILPQGITLSSKVQKVEVNKDIDPKIFDMPK